MSKPSAKIIQGLLKFHFNHNPARFSSFSEPLVNARGFSFRISNGFSNSAKTHIHPNFQSSFAKPTFSNGRLTPNLSSFSSFFGNFKLGGGGSACKSLGFGRLYFDPLRVRCFSTKVSGFGSKLNSGLGKKVFEKPLSAVGTRFSRYREAVGLQIEGFFKRNYLFLVGAGAVFMCILLWRVMFGIANAFVGLSEGMAKYGFLALSSAMVAFAGIYLRSRYTINPDKVYRMAMRELNTSAGILEVMGTPLTGTDLRAYVMSGGGLALRKFSPKLRSKRCFLIFPIRGSEKRGLVSVEVKKKKGQYDMKLLAVDIPMASGPDQRLFLIGDEEEYRIGGGLITELREPVIKAMAATKEFEEMDEIEEEEDAARELQKAQQKQQEEIAALERERAR